MGQPQSSSFVRPRAHAPADASASSNTWVLLTRLGEKVQIASAVKYHGDRGDGHHDRPGDHGSEGSWNSLDVKKKRG